MSRITAKYAKRARAVSLMGVLMVSVACTPINRYHGFVPSQAELDALTVGVDTRDSVVAAVGQPTSQGALGNDTLYYVSSQFRYFGALPPREVERQVLAISFDTGGRVRNIERFTLEDGRIVVLDRRVTDDGIEDVTFLGQLFGSFGRVDAGQIIGDGGQDPF